MLMQMAEIEMQYDDDTFDMGTSFVKWYGETKRGTRSVTYSMQRKLVVDRGS